MIVECSILVLGICNPKRRVLLDEIERIIRAGLERHRGANALVGSRTVLLVLVAVEAHHAVFGVAVEVRFVNASEGSAVHALLKANLVAQTHRHRIRRFIAGRIAVAIERHIVGAQRNGGSGNLHLDGLGVVAVAFDRYQNLAGVVSLSRIGGVGELTGESIGYIALGVSALCRILQLFALVDHRRNVFDLHVLTSRVGIGDVAITHRIAGNLGRCLCLVGDQTGNLLEGVNQALRIAGSEVLRGIVEALGIVSFRSPCRMLHDVLAQVHVIPVPAEAVAVFIGGIWIEIAVVLIRHFAVVIAGLTDVTEDFCFITIDIALILVPQRPKLPVAGRIVVHTRKRVVEILAGIEHHVGHRAHGIGLNIRAETDGVHVCRVLRSCAPVVAIVVRTDGVLHIGSSGKRHEAVSAMRAVVVAATDGTDVIAVAQIPPGSASNLNLIVNSTKIGVTINERVIMLPATIADSIARIIR